MIWDIFFSILLVISWGFAILWLGSLAIMLILAIVNYVGTSIEEKQEADRRATIISRR